MTALLCSTLSSGVFRTVRRQRMWWCSMLTEPDLFPSVQRMRSSSACCALVALLCACASAPRTSPLDPNKIVDLSHGFGAETIYWPTAEPFSIERVAYGPTPAGYWYAANNICMAEHGGTHMDAPIHFAENKRTADRVPLSSLIGPAVVIDVRTQAADDRDYRLNVEDIRSWESEHGRVPKGAIVVMNSGWGAFWPNKKRFLGSDKKRDVENLHFPGFSREAAEFLVRERNIAAIAVDTPSIDHGPSTDFIVHRIINGADKPGFENVANVDRLPAAGATFVGLPLKIEGGSGAPARIIAILP
jgi:kynurenine formamidase